MSSSGTAIEIESIEVRVSELELAAANSKPFRNDSSM
jgi:hypothetical protein